MQCAKYLLEYPAGWFSKLDHGEEQARKDVLPLVLYCLLSVVGSTFNIFHISALVIQEPLRHRINVLLANQALANLLVTLGAFPAFCIAILAGCPFHHTVQAFDWYTSILCILVTSSSGLILSFLSCIRHRPNGPMVGSAMALSWLLSAFIIIIPPYCPTFHANLYLLFLSPLILSLALFLIAIYSLKKQKPEVVNREELLQRKLLKSNMIAHVFIFCFWMPFLVALGVSSEPRVVHNLLAFAQLSCCIWPLIYPATHSAFGQAFVHLTRYFCLKTHPEFSKASYHDKPHQGMVRVHMMGMEARMHRGTDGRRDQDLKDRPEEIFL